MPLLAPPLHAVCFDWGGTLMGEDGPPGLPMADWPRLTVVDGALVVFEVNPRFSGTEAMRAMAGWNGPEALVDAHLGAPGRLAGFRARPRTFIRTLSEHELERPAPDDPGGARGTP